MRKLLCHLGALLLLSGTAASQTPEVIHYTFDNGNVENIAVPGTGGTIDDLSVGFVAGGLCSNLGTGAAESMGAFGYTHIDTGWLMDLGTGSWSIGMHLDLTVGGHSLQHFFGNPASGSAGLLYSFCGNANRLEDIALGLPGEEVYIPKGASTTEPVHVVWVYHAPQAKVLGYLNGELAVVQDIQFPPNLMGGTGNFTLMGFGFGMRPGNRMDDFRIYRRAITQEEVRYWSVCQGSNLGDVYCSPSAINSTGYGATIVAIGSPVAADNDFRLVSGNLPNSNFAMFLGSRTQGLVVGPGGSQGNLCVLGNLAYFKAPGQVGQIFGGQFSAQLSLANFPEPPTFNVSVLAGETWNFQCWYRDYNPGPTSNFSEAVEVQFQ